MPFVGKVALINFVCLIEDIQKAKLSSSWAMNLFPRYSSFTYYLTDLAVIAKGVNEHVEHGM